MRAYGYADQQSAAREGGYRVQGRRLEGAERLLGDALALEDAGAFALLLEALPAGAAGFGRDRLGNSPPSSKGVPNAW